MHHEVCTPLQQGLDCNMTVSGPFYALLLLSGVEQRTLLHSLVWQPETDVPDSRPCQHLLVALCLQRLPKSGGCEYALAHYAYLQGCRSGADRGLSEPTQALGILGMPGAAVPPPAAHAMVSEADLEVSMHNLRPGTFCSALAAGPGPELHA